MHGKYKKNKIWGGAVGSVSYNKSPKRFGIKESLKLPPLSTKPVFGDQKIGKLTISESSIPKLSAYKSNSKYGPESARESHFGGGGNQRMSEYKPSTAAQSMANLDNKMIGDHHRSPKNMRRTHQGRNPMGSIATMPPA